MYVCMYVCMCVCIACTHACIQTFNIAACISATKMKVEINNIFMYILNFVKVTE